tara:strand:- start:5275 stop:5604 length:330 start_codon:yes stop_codon:yes gene_type:complete
MCTSQLLFHQAKYYLGLDIKILRNKKNRSVNWLLFRYKFYSSGGFPKKVSILRGLSAGISCNLLNNRLLKFLKRNIYTFITIFFAFYIAIFVPETNHPFICFHNTLLFL